MKRAFRLAAALLALAGARALAAGDGKPAPAPPAPVVTTIVARSIEFVDVALVTGTLAPREEILVGAEIDGLRIVELLADENDRVTRGQVMARLARDTLDAQVLQSNAQLGRADAAIAQARSAITQAEVALTESRNSLERAKTLRKTGATTEAILDQRVADARGNEARLAAARDGLRLAEADKAALAAQRQELLVRVARTQVQAPASGVVSRRSARIGAVASMAGEPMFRIIADGDIELEADAPDFRLARIAHGQPATVVTAGGRKVKGKVRLVSPEIDRASRLGKVRVVLDHDPALRIGAFARGEIEIARRMGLALPASAVLYDARGAYAQLVREGKVATRRLTTGLVVGGEVEILSGAAEGDIFVRRAGAFLNDGDEVTARPAATAKAERAQ